MFRYSGPQRRSACAAFFVAACMSPFLCAAASQTAQAQTGAAAWNGGRMFVPAALSASGKPCEAAPGGACEMQMKPGRHPVVLFLHGCGGPRAPKAFLDLGAVVVAPNSFAGGAKCTPDAAAIARLIEARHADVKFAAERLKASAWADPARLVLAGFSNGAQTTATYAGDEFKARVIVAWTCNNPRRPEQNGVRGSGPVLALLGSADEFYKKVGIGGDCGNAVKARGEGSRSVLIAGGGHDILDHAATREAVAVFVPAVTK